MLPLEAFQGNGMLAWDIEKARSSRLLVAISFHYVRERLAILSRTLTSLSGFLTKRLDVIVLTNTADPEELAALETLCRDYTEPPMRSTPRSCPDLAHPYMLTWEHKRLIPEIFLASDSPYTHFLYLEDDIQFSFLNFCYFVTCRPLLKPRNLIPSFTRIEYSRALERNVITDNIPDLGLIRSEVCRYGDHIFVNPWSAYAGMYLLDAELAREYAASASFDSEQSKSVSNWEIRERAAMGLAFEAIPEGGASRLVLPVLAETKLPPLCSWIYHLPNNYADDPDSPFGKMTARPTSQVPRAANGAAN